jgi:hypothetical protein
MGEYTPNKNNDGITLYGKDAELVRGVLQQHIEDVAKVFNSLDVPVAVKESQCRNDDYNRPTRRSAQDNSIVESAEVARQPRRVGIQQQDGQIIEVDVARFPDGDSVIKLARPIVRNSNGEYEFEQLSIKDQLPKSFSGPVATEIIKPRRKISRRMKIIAGTAVAASVGLGASVVAFPGLLPTDKSQNILPAGGDIATDAPSTNIQDADGLLAATDIAIGDCLDESGNGKALAQGVVSLNANMQWKIKTIAGKDAIIKTTKDDKTVVYPKLMVEGATVNLAACIPSDVRNDAVILDANTVKINWDKIDRQIGIIPGAVQPTTEVWDTIEAIPGVTDQATVADLIRNMNDAATTPALAAAIAEKVATDMINADNEKLTKTQTVMQDRLIADINARVAGLYAAKKSQTEKVTVEFTGTPKALVYKTSVPTTSPKFDVSDVVLSQYEPEVKK